MRPRPRPRSKRNSQATAAPWICTGRPQPAYWPMTSVHPSLGFGLGLRVDHYEAILADRPPVDWFEVLTENYLVPGGKPLDYLMRFRERYPLVMHGVSMSI